MKKKSSKKAPKKAVSKKAAPKKAAPKKAAVPATVDLKKVGAHARSLAEELELAIRKEPGGGSFGGVCLKFYPDSPIPKLLDVDEVTCRIRGGKWVPN